MTGLTITGGTLIDPVADEERDGVVHVDDGLIAASEPEFAEPLDATGLHVAPGIVDLGVFAVDLPAFVAGGITRAALMPDQLVPLDEPSLIQRAAASGKPDVWIHPIAAATAGLDGEELAEIGLMQRAGACAVATGKSWIADGSVMLRVLRYAAALDLTVITTAEDAGLAGSAVATDGETSTRLGLAGAPAIAEAIAIARDLMLAEEAGARIHFRNVTTARGFDLIRDAKSRGLPVTCGITPAHLILCDVDIGPYRTFAKLTPPLRSADDRDAALAALADGTIDVIASGHDPQGTEAKRLPYADAEPGMAGAETLLTMSLGLVRDGRITLSRLFALLSSNPARILGIPGGSLDKGSPADIVMFDSDAPWKIDSEKMAASAGNTPFDGLPVQGRIAHVIKGGRLVIDRP